MGYESVSFVQLDVGECVVVVKMLLEMIVPGSTFACAQQKTLCFMESVEQGCTLLVSVCVMYSVLPYIILITKQVDYKGKNNIVQKIVIMRFNNF